MASEGVGGDAVGSAGGADATKERHYEVEDRPEQLKVVNELLEEMIKRTLRWAPNVVSPPVVVRKDVAGISFPFESANADRLARIDELILRSCQELGKKQVKDPLFTFAWYLNSKLYEPGKQHLAAELLSVRATRSAQLMQDYRMEKNKDDVAAELRARGLLRKKGSQP